MERVGIRALQQHASEVVRRAAAGEVVEVTDRGRLVARLVPAGASRLEALIEAGIARPARRRISELAAPIRTPSSAVLTDLLEQSRQAER